MKNESKINTKLPSSEAIDHSLFIEKLPGYFLIACLGVTLFWLIKILSPFLAVIFLAGVLAIAFNPLYKKILGWFKGWQRSASLVTCLIIIIMIILPFVFFSFLLVNEGKNTYVEVQQKVSSGELDKYLLWEEGGFFYDWKKEIETTFDLEPINLKEEIVNRAEAWSENIAAFTAAVAAGLSNLVLNFFVMLFAMYYFFKDGDKIVEKFGNLSPLPSKYEGQLFSKLSAMVKAILIGVFLTAILQGIVGGIGFAIAGVTSPVFWGTAMAFFSLLPMFGTAVIWFPAAVILAAMGSYGAAIFIFLWGMLVIGLVDNVARPYLIGGKAHTYPLLTFFVILGGVFTMGLKGVIIGPLVLMALMSFLHIYEAEYSKVLKK